MNKIRTNRLTPPAGAMLLTALMAALGLSCAATDDGTSSDPSPAGKVPSGEETPGAKGADDITNTLDESMGKLLARTTRGSGTLSLYEPEPGVVIEVETGSIDDGALQSGEDLSFTQRYELLAGERAPQALVAAEVRAEATAPRAGGIAPIPMTRAAQVDRAPISKSSGRASEKGFLDKYCLRQDRFFGGERWTGDSFWEASGLNYVQAGVFVYQGTIRYRFTHTIPQIMTDEDYVEANKDLHVDQGFYVGFRVKTTVNRSSSSRVSLADGAGYYHCVNYHF